MRRIPHVTRFSNRLSVVGPTALVLAALLLVPAPSRAEIEAPTQIDKLISRQVALVLQELHISGKELDDSLSQRFLENYVDTLDPLKLYFYKSDVESLAEHKDSIDDYLKQGDLSFAFDVYRLFLQRVADRTEAALALIDEDHDFTQDEQLLTDRKLTAYPARGQEMNELWRKRIKLRLLQRIADGDSLEESRKEVAKFYRDFHDRLQLADNAEVLQTYLTALTTVYDPHTTYMSADTLENFQIGMRLELEGIGAALQSIDGYTVVSQIVPGGAAARDGRLQAQDKILAVAQGKEGEFEAVTGRKLMDVVKRIRGKKGTIVRLKVLQAQDKTETILELERAKVELSYSEAYGEIVEMETAPGKKLRVGVVDLPSFYLDMSAAIRGVKNPKSSTRDVEKLLRNFNKQGVDAVVVDLRGNGGGSLKEAVDMTGLFIDKGPVVQIKSPRGLEKKDDTRAGMLWDGPLVVLTSRLSASASEIFAGAIQDYGRGLVIGDQSTHGKGTVQQLLPLGDDRLGALGKKMGALKITVSQFYRPSGKSTQHLGVVPDIELPSVTSYLDGEASLDNALDFDRVSSVRFRKLGVVTPEIVGSLAKLSETRRAKNDEFETAREDIRKFLELKNRKHVTLNKKKYLAEREETLGPDIKKEDPDDAPKEEPRSLLDRTIRRDYYLDEVLAITADFVHEVS